MDILYNFMERLKQLSDPLPKGIYSSLGFWKYNGSTSDYWKQFHLWQCDISGLVDPCPPWGTDWTFHQYTFKLDGLAWGAESLDLDGDYYNGTEEEMVAKFNLGPLNDSGSTVPVPNPDPIPPTPVPTKKYFIPNVSDLNMRSLPTTATDLNKVGKAVINSENLVIAEKDTENQKWIETEVWMATNGFGKIVEK
jgi:hypothetical protein